jgi:Icc-related predicted phosphoesterase
MLCRVTADLHGNLPDVEPCDLFLIAGDVCPVNDHNIAYQRSWLRQEFTYWLDQVDAKHKVWIAGNHDFVCEQPGFRRIADEIPGTYLCDDKITVEGVDIYGSPWVPNLARWAFYADSKNLKAKAMTVPSTDILLLHGPPAGRLDHVNGSGSVGSLEMADRLATITPRYVLFGHIHEGFGQEDKPGTTYINASYVNEYYEAVNHIVEFEIEREGVSDRGD